MSGRHKWSDIRKKAAPEVLASAARKKEAILVAMELDELRRRRKITQEELAARLGKSQPHISQLERRDDMHLSTLREVINALGGGLRIEAEFPDGERVRLTRFEGRKNEPSDQPSAEATQETISRPMRFDTAVYIADGFDGFDVVQKLRLRKSRLDDLSQTDYVTNS